MGGRQTKQYTAQFRDEVTKLVLNGEKTAACKPRIRLC